MEHWRPLLQRIASNGLAVEVIVSPKLIVSTPPAMRAIHCVVLAGMNLHQMIVIGMVCSCPLLQQFGYGDRRYNGAAPRRA